MSEVQVEQKTYQMPPQDGITIAHFLTVADDVQLADFTNVWRSQRGEQARGSLSTFGGGPTPDKPTVTLSVPADPDSVSSFMNIRVADIHACYELWRSRGAEFITEPKEQYGETCCYMRDPDGYIVEVGQSKPGFAYG